jgi:hypothetical protein
MKSKGERVSPWIVPLVMGIGEPDVLLRRICVVEFV